MKSNLRKLFLQRVTRMYLKREFGCILMRVIGHLGTECLLSGEEIATALKLEFVKPWRRSWRRKWLKDFLKTASNDEPVESSATCY